MAFMTKKKKYKFQVEICLEELLEVPFVSAVLFAKLRLLDGGFQDHSSRQEVAEHAVKWVSRFSFPCKMLANASTGVLEPCILRISVRKECKGGRSFTKLGFVDLNLAEFAGAGETSRKALLEGYDNRRRQDNSMLRFSIKMNMLSGDILFKVPSPSLKHKSVVTEDIANETRTLDDFSSSSLAGSIASASSGFGSLPKKRPPLLASELMLGQTDAVTTDGTDVPILVTETDEGACEPGHSRNSSNTSQLSKASGYSSIQSHSRQSSSGDSGHIRDLHKPKRILQTTPGKSLPILYQSQLSNVSSSSAEEYKTAEGSFLEHDVCLRANANCTNNMLTINEVADHRHSANSGLNNNHDLSEKGVFRSRSAFEIPQKSQRENIFQNFNHKDVLFSFLTPNARRRIQNNLVNQSTPKQNNIKHNHFKIPASPIFKFPQYSLPGTRTASPTLRSSDGLQAQAERGLPHRKLLEGNSGGKLAPVAISPDETPATVLLDCTQNSSARRPSITINPSSSSLVLSETGSLDRAKAALERRKKAQVQESDLSTVSGRVEVTRVNPDHLIAELLKNTNLDQSDDSAETSGLQLFIAKDGTAALGNHEVKSQMSTGVFKQVVMEDKR